MTRLILLLTLVSFALAAQDVTVTVQITVDAALAPVIQAWIDDPSQCVRDETVCAETGADGACIHHEENCLEWAFSSSIDLVRQTAQDAVDAKLRSIVQWAKTHNRDVLPVAVKAAIDAAETAQNTADAAVDGMTP